jgi:1-deoxy-D-xylulose-5-phosphate synthase
MTLFAPRDSKTLEYAVQFATNFQDGPCALRYPRGAFDELEFEATKFEYGKSQLLKQTTSKIAFIGYGAGVSKAIQTSKLIKEDVNIVDLRFVKPLDEEFLLTLAKQTNQWYIFSDSQKQGGVGSALLEFLGEHNLNIKLVSFEYEDIYIQHGDKKLLEEDLGILPSQLAKRIN